MESIQFIRITNIGIIENLEIRLKRFNFAIGDNGLGKTTLKYALNFGMQGGNDSDVLRNGVDMGSVYFLFNDGSTLEKKIPRDKKSTLTYIDANGIPQDNVPTWLNAYRNIDSVDAASFLNIKKKEDQIKALLEAVTIDLDKDRIAAIAGDIEYQKSANALDTINSLKKALFEKRTRVNGAEETNRTTSETMKAKLPPPSSTSPATEIEALKARKKQLEDNYDNLRARLEADRSQTIDTLEKEQKDAIETSNNTHEKRCATADKQLEAAIELLREQHRKTIADWNKEHLTEISRLSEPNPAIAEARTEFDLQISFNKEAFKSEHDPLITRLAAAEEELRTYDMVEANRQTVKELEAKADKFKAESERLTTALGDLNLYKEEILKALPGVDIREEGIYIYDGKEYIHIDKVNTARKMIFFLDLAKLRSKKLHFISLDNTESMTETTIGAFMEMTENDPFQYLFNRAMAKVPLQVISGDTREEIEEKFEKVKSDLVTA
jgi:hypothetical protein